MNIYITPEQYDRAKDNGVSYSTLNARVRNYNWDMELAVTTPPKPRNLGRKIPAEWAGIAEVNGINYQVFANRLKRLGWAPERAASTTKADARRLRDERQRLFTVEELTQIKLIGITPSGVKQRLRNGWQREKALSTPPIPRGHRKFYQKRAFESSRGGKS